MTQFEKEVVSSKGEGNDEKNRKERRRCDKSQLMSQLGKYKRCVALAWGAEVRVWMDVINSPSLGLKALYSERELLVACSVSVSCIFCCSLPLTLTRGCSRVPMLLPSG